MTYHSIKIAGEGSLKPRLDDPFTFENANQSVPLKRQKTAMQKKPQGFPQAPDKLETSREAILEPRLDDFAQNRTRNSLDSGKSLQNTPRKRDAPISDNIEARNPIPRSSSSTQPSASKAIMMEKRDADMTPLQQTEKSSGASSKFHTTASSKAPETRIQADLMVQEFSRGSQQKETTGYRTEPVEDAVENEIFRWNF